MIRYTSIAALWLFGAMFVFVGINKNDPYLIALRGTGNVALFIACVTMAFVLIRRGYWQRGITARLLVLLWCLAPISMLAAHATFETRKRAALQTDAAAAHALGRHFMVGYSSFEEVTRLAEKGMIAGVYVSRRNIVRSTAKGLTAEISDLQARRRRANLPPLIVAADQEGGIVSHLSPALTKLPALATLAGLPPDIRA